MVRSRILRVFIAGNNKGAVNAMSGVQKAGQRLSNDLKRLAGVAGVSSLTLALTKVGGAVAETTLGFEKAMTKIQALVGLTSGEVSSMEDGVKQLAQTTGIDLNELADALFFITSAGIRDTGEALDTLEAASKGAAAGLGSTKDVAFAAVSAMNAYGRENLNAALATDIITTAVREGNLEASEFSSAIAQVIPIASNLGVSFDQAAAAMATMTRTGASASEAATGLKGIMNALNKPTDQANAAFARMGTSAGELRQQIKDEGLLSVLSTLSTRFQGNEQDIAQVFGRIQGLTGFLQLFGNNVGDTIDIFNGLAGAAGATDEAFGIVNDTAQHKLNQALQRLKVVGLEIGQQVLPEIADFAEDMAKALAAATPHIREMAAAWGDLLTDTATTEFFADVAEGIGEFAAGIQELQNVGSAEGRGLNAVRDAVHFLGQEGKLTGTRLFDMQKAMQLLIQDGNLHANTVRGLQTEFSATNREIAVSVENLDKWLGTADVDKVELIQVIEEVIGNLDYFNQVVPEGSDYMDTWVRRVDESAKATGQYGDQVVDTADDQRVLNRVLDQQADKQQTLIDKLKEAKQEQQGLGSTVKSAAQPIFDLASAIERYESVLEDVNEDSKRHAETDQDLIESKAAVEAILSDIDPSEWAVALEALGVVTNQELDDVVDLVEGWGIVLGDEGNLIGAKLGDGLVAGWRASLARAEFEMAAGINRIVDAAKGAAGISSPSKVFAEEVGEPIAEGVAEGILEKRREASDAVETLMDEVKDKAEEGLQDIFDSIDAVLGKTDALESFQEIQAEIADLSGPAQDRLAEFIRQEEAKIQDLKDTVTGITQEIRDTESALDLAKQQSQLVTPEEQLAIENAAKNLARIKEQFKEGEASAAAVAVAENQLAQAIADSTSPTRQQEDLERKLIKLREDRIETIDDLAEAERELAEEVRERQREITEDLEKAERDLIDAQLRLIESQKDLIETGGALEDMTNAELEAFLRLARAAGLAHDEIMALLGLPSVAFDEFQNFDPVVLPGLTPTPVIGEFEGTVRDGEVTLSEATLQRLAELWAGTSGGLIGQTGGIVVNANTQADPLDIASELGFLLRTLGVI